ncbi:MAG: CoA transferase [Spirochaetaceae bacterium]|nr:CoA transferase [Spirochaetaceae bacterium]
MTGQQDVGGGAALAGVRVLDATRVLAGPYCTMVLADMGADVVKVERPAGGDDTRAWGPPYLGDPADGLSAYFLAVNRSKRSVAIDLRSERGRRLFLDLAGKSDVVVENFAPGVAERLGLDHAALSAARPDLVHCSITAFGRKPGPGYDLVIQGLSGLMSLTGEPDGFPMKVGVALTDVIAGLHAASAILAAVISRQRTGRGQHLEVNLMGSTVAALVNVAQAFLLNGNPPRRFGNAHPQIVPYEVYAAGDGYLTIGAGNDKLFTGLCTVLGCPELLHDARFGDNSARVANRAALNAVLTPLIARRAVAELVGELTAAGVPAGAVADLPGVFGAPPAAPAGVNLLELAAADDRRYLSVGPVVEMPGLRGHPCGAPLLGQHTHEVLAELLGLAAPRLAELEREGAIATA